MVEIMEPVSVHIFFDKNRFQPCLLFWRNRSIKIDKIHLVHTSQSGASLFYHFSVTSHSNFYRLKFDVAKMLAARLRSRKMVGKTVHCWYRSSFNLALHPGGVGMKLFEGGGAQKTLGHPTADGLEIFQTAWQVFLQTWDRNPIRMIGTSVSNLQEIKLQTLNFLPEEKRRKLINQTLDKVNHKFGDFTLQRGTLLVSPSIRRNPNPYLSDRRFKL